MNFISFRNSLALLIFVLLINFLYTGCFFNRSLRRQDRRISRRAAQSTETYQAFLANKECGLLESLYRKSSGVPSSLKTERKNHYHSELARCGQWDVFFRKEMHHGRGAGVRYLEHLTSKGYPVKKEFFRWLGNGSVWKWPAHQPRHLQSHYAMYDMHAAKNVLAWLQSHSKPQRVCQRFTQAEPQFASWVKQAYIDFMAKNQCRGLRRILRRQLSSRNTGAKQQACRYLGEYGRRSDAAKMMILARTDSSWYRPAGARRRIYTSTVCQQSAGRVQLRN